MNFKHRLGLVEVAEKLKRHPFFANVDWNALSSITALYCGAIGWASPSRAEEGKRTALPSLRSDCPLKLITNP